MIAYPAKFTYDKSDKVYLVEFPDLTGCVTFGENLDEAFKHAIEALSGYLESIDLRSIDIPEPSPLKGKNIHLIQPEKKVAFALWLKIKRKEKGLSQKDVAGLLNITFQTYQRFEDPKKTNPTLATIQKFEKIFGEIVIDV